MSFLENLKKIKTLSDDLVKYGVEEKLPKVKEALEITEKLIKLFENNAPKESCGLHLLNSGQYGLLKQLLKSILPKVIAPAMWKEEYGSHDCITMQKNDDDKKSVKKIMLSIDVCYLELLENFDNSYQIGTSVLLKNEEESNKNTFFGKNNLGIKAEAYFKNALKKLLDYQEAIRCSSYFKHNSSFFYKKWDDHYQCKSKSQKEYSNFFAQLNKFRTLSQNEYYNLFFKKIDEFRTVSRKEYRNFFKESGKFEDFYSCEITIPPILNYFEKIKNKAINYLEKAAELKHIKAMEIIGMAKMTGKIVDENRVILCKNYPKDISVGREMLLVVGSHTNSPECIFECAKSFLREAIDEANEKLLDKALECFIKVCEYNDKTYTSLASSTIMNLYKEGLKAKDSSILLEPNSIQVKEIIEKFNVEFLFESSCTPRILGTEELYKKKESENTNSYKY